jgi:hypothetical protein
VSRGLHREQHHTHRITSHHMPCTLHTTCTALHTTPSPRSSTHRAVAYHL